jgi:GH24 family phage-related lysozyme (muramidase)
MTRRDVFEAVRQARGGRGFAVAEIATLDRALDELEVPRPDPVPVPAPAPAHPEPVEGRAGLLRVSAVGEALIQRFEGFARVRADGRVEAYPDAGRGWDLPTIGWGSTGADIKRGTVWTRAQCEERFRLHIEHFAAEVRAVIGNAPTTQGQFDALVSFHYNTGQIAKATLTRLHKAGDFAGAAAQFARWNKAAGKVLTGLTRRRAAEAALYKGNDHA